MSTIHVKEKFTYTDPAGNRHDFAAGTHSGVDRKVAEHPFVQAHCSEKPIVVVADDAAGQIAALTAERDLLVVRLTDAEATILSTGNANTALHDKLIAANDERDQLQTVLTGLTAERNDLTAANTALRDDNSSLTDQVATLTAERDQLGNQVATLTAERDQLGNQVADLQAGSAPAGKKK